MKGERVATGVPGLDGIVDGGLPAGGTYLLLGQPGTGKTTVGLQFLLEGARHGEKCLYLSMAETRGQLGAVADSYGWTLDGIDIHEMRRRGGSDSDSVRARYTVFSPSEVECEDIVREFREQLEIFQPTRLVFDSLTELRMLAESGLYRRELLGLSDQLDGQGCTSWFIDVMTSAEEMSVFETIASGSLILERLLPAYGGDRRRLHVRKIRASRSHGGYHDFAITEKGAELYSRLVSASDRAAHPGGAVPSGVVELDAILGGGLDRSTSSLFMGAAGAGKSTAAAQFVTAAAARGDRGAFFCFDESPTSLLIRTTSLGILLAEQVKAGKVELTLVNPAEYSPGQLSHQIRRQVDEGARVVVLDSVNGYMDALPEERYLAAHLRDLLAFLAERGVCTILTLAERGLLVGALETPVDLSYVVDTVVLFQHFGEPGAGKQGISVVKKRTGGHERSIRELSFGPSGLVVGPPLTRPQDLWAGGPRNGSE